MERIQGGVDPRRTPMVPKISLQMASIWRLDTRYFHGTMVVRRRRNRIETLQDQDGNWISEKAMLEKLATAFYVELYKDDPGSVPYVLRGSFMALAVWEVMSHSI